MADTYLRGSICLTDIPRELIKEFQCKDGKKRKYLDIAILSRREPKTFTNEHGSRTLTHYVSCRPAPAQCVDGVNYFIGDLETKAFGAQGTQQPSAPAAEDNNDLPF